MRSIRVRVRWILALGTTLAIGGCVTSGQLTDFVRSEFARVVADLVGQTFNLLIQGSV